MSKVNNKDRMTSLTLKIFLTLVYCYFEHVKMFAETNLFLFRALNWYLPAERRIS